MALIKRRIKVWELPLNWLIVFCGNLAGALCYVAFMGMLALTRVAHFRDSGGSNLEIPD
jgi:formate/nitrite transporter FocA (FNT family)